jgi:DNA polymerase III psi subunit
MIENVSGIIFTEELYLIRRTTLIFSQPLDTIGEQDRALLDKILQAVKLSFNDVLVVHQTTLDLGALVVRPKRAVYFGNPVTGLSPFEVISVEGSSIVMAPALSALHNDPASKQKLWTALRMLFGR